MSRTPTILVTDLYHSSQVVGDNVEILMPMSLEIDLRAVILPTATQRPVRADDPARDRPVVADSRRG
ncbi:hypothetical protein [Microbacterium sp. Root61]|uniref:hypothetical protein n=1 Tax=Microbacterium sp. Root61 TaxID=1736570 RepID=UPI000B1E655C|nr:hypothetical protein [Microbacterium sp. Root61]